MEQLGFREKLRIVGTVEKLNRQAVAIGQNGKIRAAKSVIQLKPVGESQWQIWISVAKDLDGQRYDVISIQKLRTNFVNEGKLTIELRQPPLNLMLRDCRPEDLSTLVQKLEYIKKNSDRLKTNPAAASSSSSTTVILSTSLSYPNKNCNATTTTATPRVIRRENILPSNSSLSQDCHQTQNGKNREDLRPRLLKSTSLTNVIGKDEMNKEGGSVGVKQNSRGTKRAHEDMSKKEAASLRKVLRTSITSLVVTERSEYPLKGLSKDLQRIVFQGIQLRRVDTRISDLTHLRILSLENNRIVNIEPLTDLKSCLERLNLSENLIEVISDSVFRSKGLSKLQQLILNRNKLTTLPNSICELRHLRDLQISNNFLHVLPYNLHQLMNLMTLKVNNNKLKSLPLPISKLKLHHLDVSSNLFTRTNDAPRKVRFEAEPTLFELAGGTLLSQLYKEKMKGNSDQRKIDVFDTTVVPRSISDHLDRSKYCYQCGNIHLRYTLNFSQTRHDFALEAVNSLVGGLVPTCEAICDKCLNSKNLLII